MSSLTFAFLVLLPIVLIESEQMTEWGLTLILAHSPLALGLYLLFCEVAQFQTKS